MKKTLSWLRLESGGSVPCDAVAMTLRRGHQGGKPDLPLARLRAGTPWPVHFSPCSSRSSP